MTAATLSIAEAQELTSVALKASNTNEVNTASVTRSVIAAELDGIHSHGLARLPTYCARCGKIDGNAKPVLGHLSDASLKVDARDGFAHPAIDLGFENLIPLALEGRRRTGGRQFLQLRRAGLSCGSAGRGRFAGAGLYQRARLNRAGRWQQGRLRH